VAGIEIRSELCKNCGLCVIACPKGVIGTGKTVNKKGFTPVEMKNDDCVGCSMCAVVCPEAAIEVFGK